MSASLRWFQHGSTGRFAITGENLLRNLIKTELFIHFVKFVGDWSPHIHPLPSTLIRSLCPPQNLNLAQHFITMIFYHNTEFSSLFGNSSRKEIWVWCTSINWLTYSEIFFYDFENIFPYYLFWSRNKFESSPLNFKSTNWLTRHWET